MGIPVVLKPKSETMFITNTKPQTGGEYSGVSRVSRPRADSELQILKAKYGEDKANAVWKLKQNYHRVDQTRTEKCVKVIDYIQPSFTGTKPRSKSIHVCRCQATTLTGRRCPFKATHGDFCKKHMV